MKHSITVFLFVIFAQLLSAQNALSSQRHMVFSSGFTQPHFLRGQELLRANNLREQGQSYFRDVEGNRASVGNYPANTGFSLSIGYYLPVKRISGLRLGAVVNSGQTGATPTQAGYAEGYFFNFLNFGATAQYFPLAEANLYVKAEVGMGSVFTKNRYVNAGGEQDFLHHFGIGLEGGAGLGYLITPFGQDKPGFLLEASYQLYSTRVEVSGIGDDQWRFGALHLAAGIAF
jgi:hypothetical protein